MRNHALILVLGVAASPLFFAGCGSHATSVCSLVCECEHCSDLEEDNCDATLEGTGNMAEAYGCEQEFDDILTCIEDSGRCEEKDARYTTTEKGTATCALATPMNPTDCSMNPMMCDGMGFGAVCDAGVCKYNMCSGTQNPCNSSTECNQGGKDRCQKDYESLNKCVEDATGHKQNVQQPPQNGGAGGAG